MIFHSSKNSNSYFSAVKALSSYSLSSLLSLTMEFLSFNTTTKDLSLKTGPIPVPEKNEVLVRVAYSGVCGTDLHILEGLFPTKKNDSLILGHEFVGTIESLGNEVRDLKIGQKVSIDPNKGCNKCADCYKGYYHFCESGRVNFTIGIFRNGGWATHVTVLESQIHLIPEGVDMLQAALVEPLSCIVHGWDLINPVAVGSEVLIIGAGIIGLLWACTLHLYGLRKTVTIGEAMPMRQKIAVNLGLDYAVCTPNQLAGKNFDFVIDCSGSASAIESALPLLSNRGTLCIFGVANPTATMKVNPFEIFMKELKIIGVKVNPFTFPNGLSLVKAMGNQYLNYEKLGIRVCKLSEYKDAIRALHEKQVTKIIFEL